MALTGCAGPEEAAMALASVCKVAVVTMDSRGSLVATGGLLHRVPVWPADLVDTTGAGDMFAAGMLYGLTQGLAPERAGMIGAETAARVVSKLGPRLDALDRTSLESLR
jgi:sugar/nucleoside kinase (ribokinase family)